MLSGSMQTLPISRCFLMKYNDSPKQRTAIGKVSCTSQVVRKSAASPFHRCTPKRQGTRLVHVQLVRTRSCHCGDSRSASAGLKMLNGLRACPASLTTNSPHFRGVAPNLRSKLLSRQANFPHGGRELAKRIAFRTNLRASIGNLIAIMPALLDNDMTRLWRPKSLPSRKRATNADREYRSHPRSHERDKRKAMMTLLKI